MSFDLNASAEDTSSIKLTAWDTRAGFGESFSHSTSAFITDVGASLGG
jgi:hypothetical protein